MNNSFLAQGAPKRIFQINLKIVDFRALYFVNTPYYSKGFEGNLINEALTGLIGRVTKQTAYKKK